MDLIEFVLIIVSISVVLFVKLLDVNPPSLFGVYQRRNGFYWLKVVITYCLLSLKKFKSSVKRNEFINNLEKPQQLSNEQVADIIYMSGSNKNGDHLTIRLETRKNCTNSQLFLKIKSSNEGLLVTKNLSDNISALSQSNFEFSDEGIKLIPLEGLKVWRLAFKGKMFEESNPKEEHNVKINGTWASRKPSFYLNNDMDTMLTAKCLAYEKFNKIYFENLKVLNGNHSEQFGILKLNIAIDKRNHEIELDTIKIRSFGNHLDWCQYHRYGIHYFVAENGDCFSIGEISQPITSSRFSFGHIYSAEDGKIRSIKRSSFKLYQYGGINAPPEDYGFTFTAGEHNYALHVKVVESSYFYIGPELEAKVNERFCTFEVNGLKGSGTSQWLYRNMGRGGRD